MQEKYIGEFIDKNETVLKLQKENYFKILKPDYRKSFICLN